MITLRVKTITELISSVILWAKETNGEGLYGHSNDGGFISMRVDELIYEGMYYKSICFMNIRMPEDKRRIGLYSSLISSIDELNLFGARWHDSVGNYHLVERHSKRGYFNRDGSFFKIIGTPHPIDIQNKMMAKRSKFYHHRYNKKPLEISNLHFKRLLKLMRHRAKM